MLQDLVDSWQNRTKGIKIGMSRFMGAISAGRDKLQQWHKRVLELVYYGLTSGRLSVEKYNKILASNPSPDTGKFGETTTEKTSVKRGDDELKHLRSVCDNTQQVTTIFFLDEENHWRQSIIVKVSEACALWQGMSNKANRSVDKTLAWHWDQCMGASLSSLSKVFHTLHDIAALDYMHFPVTFRPCELEQLHVNHPKVVQSSEFADLAGTLAVSMAARRLSRTMWMWRGWPSRCVLFAHPDAEVASKALHEFKADYDVFVAMSKQKSSVLKQMTSRSLFHLVCVQQFVELCKQEAWKITARIKEFSIKVNKRLMQSQISEDGVNRSRSAESRGRTKKMSDLRAWATLVTSSLLEEVHKYKDLDWKTETTLPGSTTLPAQLWHATQNGASMPADIKKIIGSSARSHWYSPSAANSCQVAYCYRETHKYEQRIPCSATSKHVLHNHDFII